ncbi:hypothetical protein HC891_27485, partial [Candidatus Gracilibacteria bacterium]|nr:hypothetical protein [Candidatus Gracilibacteria bacterium]
MIVVNRHAGCLLGRGGRDHQAFAGGAGEDVAVEQAGEDERCEVGRAGRRHQWAGENAVGLEAHRLLPGRCVVDAVGGEAAQQHIIVGVQHEDVGLRWCSGQQVGIGKRGSRQDRRRCATGPGVFLTVVAPALELGFDQRVGRVKWFIPLHRRQHDLAVLLEAAIRVGSAVGKAPAAHSGVVAGIVVDQGAVEAGAGGDDRQRNAAGDERVRYEHLRRVFRTAAVIEADIRRVGDTQAERLRR